MVLSVCPMAMAVSYNDSTITNSSDQWQSWVSQWENVAADYTKVPLTSGANAFLLDAAFFIPEPPPRQPGYRLQRQK